MRHPVPFVAAAISAMFLCAAVGQGLTLWLGFVWAFPIGVVFGFILLLVGTISYYRAEGITRTKVYRLLSTLFIAYFGVILGGAPGAILGHRVAGDTGEMIGWFFTAIPATVLAVIWGWRWSCRHLT